MIKSNFIQILLLLLCLSFTACLKRSQERSLSSSGNTATSIQPDSTPEEDAGNGKGFGGGNGQGYGGGDLLLTQIRGSLAALKNSLRILIKGTDTNSLCENISGNSGLDAGLVSILANLNPEQKNYCRNMILSIAPDLLKFIPDAPELLFVPKDAELFVDGPNGKQVQVVAKTEFGPTGSIFLYRPAVEKMTQSMLLALISHEILHKIEAPGISGYIPDNLPFGSFVQLGGGRAFLDSVGAALAAYSLLHPIMPEDKFSPRLISGLHLWLKADSFEGKNEGDPVENWPDLTGKSTGATQNNPVRQPSYSVRSINNLPSIRFDGTNDAMTLENLPALDKTIFIVTDNRVADFGSTLFWADCTNVKGTHWRIFSAGVLGFTDSNGVSGGAGGLLTSGAYLLEIILSRTSTSYYVNSRVIGISDSTASEANLHATIGAWPLTQGNFQQHANADISEMLIYDKALSASDRALIEDYLNKKYQLYK